MDEVEIFDGFCHLHTMRNRKRTSTNPLEGATCSFYLWIFSKSWINRLFTNTTITDLVTVFGRERCELDAWLPDPSDGSTKCDFFSPDKGGKLVEWWRGCATCEARTEWLFHVPFFWPLSCKSNAESVIWTNCSRARSNVACSSLRSSHSRCTVIFSSSIWCSWKPDSQCVMKRRRNTIWKIHD